MKIEVINVPLEEKHILGSLLKMYCYEWSQYNKMDVNDQGDYEFEYHISAYWEKENHYPFFIKVDGKLAGFVLVDDDFNLHLDYDHAIAEFFVMHKYRQAGAGRFAAKYVFDRLPGKWEIGRHPHNIGAAKFWDSVVNEYTGGQFELVKAYKDAVYHDGTCMDIIFFKK